MFPTRAWELLAGSIIYCLETSRKIKLNNKFFNEFLSILGLFLIIFSLIFFKDSMPHPSIYTTIPIIGVSLIILFSNKETYVKKLLSFKILVLVGLISYSLLFFSLAYFLHIFFQILIHQ